VTDANLHYSAEDTSFGRAASVRKRPVCILAAQTGEDCIIYYEVVDQLD
jgi:hypothetical protein